MHGRREINIKFRSENLKGRDHFEDQTENQIILQWIL